MLRDSQISILRDIGQSIAFDGDKCGEVNELVLEGLVIKDGDLYELTPKGLKYIEDLGAFTEPPTGRG
jgi:predicted transcriptional regulator